MNINTKAKICLVPRLTGIGGMVSFQSKLANGLKERNFEVVFDLNAKPYDAVLVIGGTRQIHNLWQVKRSGIRIVQRLDGMNWIHRVIKTGWRHWLRAEYGNIILSTIRSYFADKIVYQSKFSRQWWERVKGETHYPNDVIYNGVDLNEFSPVGPGDRPNDFTRLLMVEGSLLGGYEFGLENAVKLLREIAHSHHNTSQVELMIVGKVSKSIQDQWDRWIRENGDPDKVKLKWTGIVPSERIPEVDRSAHLLFSADVNAACPNTVIEALACGTPVVSFDTGALPELVGEGGGVTVSYGNNPWNLEEPDIPALAKGAEKILQDFNHFQDAARKRAETNFDVEIMVDRYIDILLG
jgi:glycosyltransferase involved in cell wall biosynthesis